MELRSPWVIVLAEDSESWRRLLIHAVDTLYVARRELHTGLRWHCSIICPRTTH